MKGLINKLFILLTVFTLSISLVACNPEEGPSDDKTNENGNGNNDGNQDGNQNGNQDGNDDGEYVYEGTLTVAPYTIYSEEGEFFAEYNNMFEAIRICGENATSKNKMYVVDGNELKIFQRQSKSKYWCYDGLNYVGSKSSSEALEWGKTRSKCYIIDGQGAGYTFIGANYYENTDFEANIPLELTSGAYNYMFSKHGVFESDTWVKPGYGYMECYVRLSEATYTPTKDDGTWNAYIFINGAGGTYHSDLGMIGVIREGVMTWALVRNCNHPDHTVPGNNFTVLSWNPVTTMKYDEEKDVYCDGDDLFFQCWQTVDGWKLNITNLRTKQVHTINEYHKNMFSGSTHYFRFLLAASYCPVVSNVWNARCEASLRNVLFDNVNIARYQSDDTYEETDFEEFYPGYDTMHYGFSQGADSASMMFGTYEQDGTYASGEKYSAGDKYVSFSCYYDGGGHYYESE